MPRESFHVEVEPEVLVWARETIGLSRTDIAKRFNVTEDLVSGWESGESKPTIKTLEELAKVYKRPLAAFFLPTAPVELPLPSDYRRFPSGTRPPLSRKTLLAIRRARRLQSVAGELAADSGRRLIPRVERLDETENPETAAKRVREQIGIGAARQLAWADEYQALNNWRDAVEDFGVLVSQTSIPLEGERIRAFSLAEPEPPIIVLNSQDSARPRVFSLFHEYAHILLGSGGICSMEEVDEQTERFCNRFAAAFLLPGADLRQHSLTQKLLRSQSSPGDLDEVLGQLASAFKVSKEAVLLRMVTLRLLRRAVYARWREEQEAKEWPQRRGGFRRDMAKECIRKNGASFVSLVLQAQRRDRITHSDVADYLGVKTKHFGEIEQLVAQKARVE